MRNDKTRITVIAMIALIVVCGGSFLGIRSLNSKAAVTLPAVQTTAQTAAQTTQAPVVTEVPTMPVATTAAQTTGAYNALSESQTGGSLSDSTTVNRFTTFAASTSASEQSTSASTTKSTSAASTYNISSKVDSLTRPTTQEEADALIDEASTFSDGFLGYLFDPKGQFFYTTSDPWQRHFGFNKLYDVGASFIVFYYDTMRCKFTYDNKDWLIQFWKGQYGFVFIGAEIGVYNKPTDRGLEHYDCASDKDSLYMSMTFYRKGKEQLTRDYGRYWWCTGFVPGVLDNFADRSELSMKARITMKDYKMLLSFCGALKENGLEIDKDYTTNGLDVYISW